jgi:acyl-CoA synthetase (AMP-forming)/AMP-acid ligase II
MSEKMTQCANLADTLVNAIQENPNNIYARFLVDGEQQEELLRFNDLLHQATALAATMQQRFAVGTRAILLFNTGLEFIISFWACVLGGFIAVPVPAPRDERSIQRLLALNKNAQPDILLTTTVLEQKIAAYPSFATVFDRSGIFLVEHNEINNNFRFTAPHLKPEAPVFLQYTSGSTGEQKGVIITHRNMMHNAKMIADVASPEGAAQLKNENLVSWLPHYHDMGLIGCIIVPALYQCTATIMSPLMFLQRPVRWLRAITRYKAAFSAAPNFGYSLCAKKIKEQDLIGLDLQHWSFALNGAEPVRAETLEQFYQKFAAVGFRQETFYPSYGLAEATVFVTGGLREASPKQITVNVHDLYEKGRVVISSSAPSQTLISCGKPGLGLCLAIIDPQKNTQLDEDLIGEIVICGDNVTSGYWQREDLNPALFITRQGKKFLKTGDLGFVHQGELYVTGRVKDLIIIRGRNLQPHDLEQSVEASDELIREGGVVSFAIDSIDKEQVIVLVEVPANTDLLQIDRIKRIILERLLHDHGIEAEIKFIPRGSIFKTSSGKLQRSQCKDFYLAGKMMIIGSHNANS